MALDGGELTFRCPACGRGLAVAQVMHTELPKRWRVRALCGFGCTTRSGSPEATPWAEFTGQFLPGGFGVRTGADVDDLAIRCGIVDYITDEKPDGLEEVTLVTKAL